MEICSFSVISSCALCVPACVRECHFVVRSQLWVLEVTAQCDLDVVNKHSLCLSV